jgi:hypothetical protein
LRWQRSLQQVRDEAVQAGCPDPPPEMREVLRVGDRVVEMSLADMADFIEPLRSWSRAIGVDDLEKYLDDDASCLRDRDGLVRATYSIQTAYTGTGKDVWLDMAIENLTDHPVAGSVSGEARLVGSTAVRQAPASWGGSGDDTWWVRPHAVGLVRLADVIGQPFHLTSGGYLDGVEVAIFIPGAGNRGCMFPVLPAD